MGGMLLTPPVSRPSHSVEAQAIRQAVGVYEPTVPKRTYAEPESESARTDDASSDGSDEPHAQQRPTDTELLEMLIHLAIIDSNKPSAAPAPPASPSRAQPLLQSPVTAAVSISPVPTAAVSASSAPVRPLTPEITPSTQQPSPPPPVQLPSVAAPELSRDGERELSQIIASPIRVVFSKRTCATASIARS